MRKIIESLAEAIEKGETKGCSVVFIEAGGQPKFHTLGTIDGNADHKVQQSTLYDLASLTKLITATTVLKWVQMGRLSLDTRVCEVLSDFPNLTMRIRALLLHNSGLAADVVDKSRLSRETYLATLKEGRYDGDHPVLYSDLGFILLGEIIEQLTGEPLETSFNSLVFDKFQMDKMTYTPDRTQTAPTEITHERGEIKGIVHDSKAFRYGKPTGHAGLFGSSVDMAKFLMAMLSGQLFDEKIYREIMQTNVSGRTLGWLCKGKGQLYHTGFTGGFVCVDLKANRGCGVLTNRTYPSRSDERFVKRRMEMIDGYFE